MSERVARESDVFGPLDGVVVVDLTRVFAGPFASQILGDLGADVIKVERFGRGEESRDYGVEEGEPSPGAPFLAHNRNKRSIGLDMKSPLGQEVLRELILRADVLIHNFRPGVMERLGFGFEQVHPLNPRLVYAGISGFGDEGPMSRRAANDLSIQSFSGLLSITGHQDGPPTRNPASVADLTAGMYAVVGVISALYAREKTGLGQSVATSMLGGQLNYLNHFLTDYWLSGRVPEKWGTANRLGLPNEAFPTSDGWVCITSANEEMWRRCATGLGMGELGEDPRFNTLRQRYANREELVRLVSEATQRMTTKECLDAMQEANVPCVPVNSIPDIAADPVLNDLGAVVEMELADGRMTRLIQTPLKFSHTPVTARIAPPEPGAHTDEILAECGFSPERVQRLRSEAAVS